LTFLAKAKEEYEVSVHDIDFGGDRSYVYRLAITPGPGIVGTLPAVGRRGETREVEFIVTGGPKLESIRRQVMFPATGSVFDYRLETPMGTSPPHRFHLGDLPEHVAFPRHDKKTETLRPGGTTGILEEPDARDVYTCAWKKGEVWSLSLEAQRIGSPLDVALSILGPAGQELARNDDLPETTDAGLDFTVPADGTYRIVISDMAGRSGSRAALYRLVMRQRPGDFNLQLATQRVHVPLDGKFDLAVKALRQGDCQGPIALTIRGLPAGISAPGGLIIPAGKSDLVVPLTAAKDAATSAGVVTIEGTTTVAGKTVTRTALARTTWNLAPRSPDDNQVPAILVATTMKPKFGGRPVDQDTVRKVHRGTTFPAEVLFNRLDGFNGEIVLQMAAQQSYQVQGITGGDVVVPPGVQRTIYPCFMPEWLETSRTSRMGIIAVARVPDPTGRVRHLVADITGFVTMTMEGALLKVSAEDNDLTVPEGQPFEVRLKVWRQPKLTEAVRLELRDSEGMTARPVVLTGKKEEAVLQITPAAGLRGLHTVTIRASALQEGKYPVVSETPVSVEVLAATPSARPGR
jgi:hypothetical protein